MENKTTKNSVEKNKPNTQKKKKNLLPKKSDKPPQISETKKKPRKNKYVKEDVIRRTFRSIRVSLLRIVEIKELTKERMKGLGVYHESFDDLILIYANMIFEYERCMEQFKDEGSLYEVETAQGGSKKSGIVSAMEALRKDIGTYSDRLLLNPKSRGMTVSVIDSGSPLENFMKDFNDTV